MAWGDPLAEPNLFTQNSVHRHAERRRQMAPLFQWSTITQFEPLFDKLTGDLHCRLTELANAHQVTKISDWFHYYALDAIGTVTVS